MIILENQILKDHYDVIVIGAGNGGLNAAALLANRGVDVLVIEQHYIPGGAVSGLRRKDITCDVGAAVLFGFTEKGYHPHYYIMNELNEPITMVRHDSVFRMYWGDKEVTFYKDTEKFYGEMAKLFPHKTKEMRKWYEWMFKVLKGMHEGELPYSISEIDLKTIKILYTADPIGQLRQLPLLLMNGRDLLKKFNLDEPEILQFYDICMGLFCSTTMEQTPGIITAAMFADMHIGGACYPYGSPQMLPNKLERAIERLGGHIIGRQMVEKITFDTSTKKPTATGVLLDNGVKISADFVISNSNIYPMFKNLVDPKLVKPKRLKFYQDMTPTTAVLILYLGVDKEVIPENRHNIEFLIDDKTSFFKNCYAFIPSVDDESIVPEGAHSMTVICTEPAHEEEWPSPNSSFYQSEEYFKLKEKWAKKILGQLEKHYPGLNDHLRFCEVSTPSTIERFLLKTGGNVAGPAQIIGQDMLRRPWARTRGFKRLYMCGDSTTLGEGVVATAASGVSAANVVLKDGKFGEPYYPHKTNNTAISFLEKGPARISVPGDDEELNEETAQRLAQQCQWCEKDSCRSNCPAGIDVLNFIRRIESGNYSGAARLMREKNPLAHICGTICPAERFCESECYRFDFDTRSTQVKRLQEWVCDKAGTDGFDSHIPQSNGRKVAVVGAGPGGLSCASFLARLGYAVDLFDKLEKTGGMLTHIIPSFRLPKEQTEKELDKILLPQINIKTSQELGKDIFVDKLAENYDSVFLAPGLWQGAKLDIPGMDGADTTDALSFIQSYAKDSNMNVKKNVLVIGGGSVAMDAASVAQKCGAKSVTLVCLESAEEMPAQKYEIEELTESGVNVVNCWGPKTVEDNKLECVSCTAVFDDDGNFSPTFDESSLKEIDFDQLVLAVGQKPEDSLGQYFEKEFGSSRLKVDSQTQLIDGRDNIYAGGDIIRAGGTVVEAVADGRRAATAIHKKLIQK